MDADVDEYAKINEVFTGQWKVAVPSGVIDSPDPVKIDHPHMEALWIVYDEDDRGIYAEVFAASRFTDDYWYRIYGDGTTTDLGAPSNFCGYDPAIPGDKERSEKEHSQAWREYGQKLAARGFRAG